MNSLDVDLEDTLIENPTRVGAEPLFTDDAGALPLDARRVLIHLLAGPFLDGKRHAKLWRLLLVHETMMRSRLGELFLELVVDHDQQVAFTRQVAMEEIDAPSLLRKTSLTFIDSVLMLYLRQLLSESDTHGERAAVSEEDIHVQLGLYEKTANTDHAGFRKRISAAVENAKKRYILRLIDGSKGRYEISPVLKLLFGAEEVIALKNQYQQLLAHSNQPADSQEDVDE